MDEAQAAGATTVRFDLAWSSVQPTSSDTWDWQPIDVVVDALRARGLHLLPVVGYTPAWARSPGCSTSTCPPASASAFASFVKAAVVRYGGPDVAAWEVWNEPNAASWTPAPDPARYAALLEATADAVHETGTRAPVLLGGLAPAVNSTTTVAPDDFVRQVYAAGAGAHIDGVAMHPYCFPALPGEGQAWSGWTQMIAVHTVMVDTGYGDQGVWATEFGTPTTGTGAGATLTDRAYTSHPDHADDAFQSATVTAAFAALPSLPWLRSLLWYSLRDLPTGGAVSQAGYGLLTSAGTPKPALDAWSKASNPFVEAR